MSDLHAKPQTFRGFLVSVCLALLAGCIPQPQILPTTAPTDLAATPGNATVTLAWTSNGADSYNVKRATTSGGPYASLASTATTGYTDSSVTNGTTYYYVVSATNAGGESGNSVPASAMPEVPVLPPVPTGVTATSALAQVNLAWSASHGATSYHVKRSTTNGGPYTQLAAPTTNSFADTTGTVGTTYYYVVSAVNVVGESANSAQVSAAPSGPPPENFGTWVNVTPNGIDLVNGSLGCQNAGARTVQMDPAHAGHVYTKFDCQGIWKSTDYGVTWTGPINTGTNAAAVSSCEGGITIAPNGSASVPTLYQSCIRGAGIGFWKSVDGGVNWTSYAIAPTPTRQDYNPPAIDPYDLNHMVMAGHEIDSVVESIDGGQNWTNVPLAAGMAQSGRTAFIFFINTGSATTTRGTWLWIGEQSGGGVGTWRTTNSGTSWTKVDNNEHLLGASQIYQPDNNGVVFMAGVYSAFDWGVLRSADYGQTWSHVGIAGTPYAVIGTSKNVYAMGFGGTNPFFEVALQPGTGTWVAPTTVAGIAPGSAQLAVVNDGTHNVLVGAMWNSGVWRYVEP